MKNYSICLRDFEERDVDFIFRCKNDESLNEMIVGQSQKITYEDARRWVDGCIGEHETYKFWAICTNDAKKEIVGWVSLSNIDSANCSACHHGIVIGEKSYRDGFAMFEAMLLSMDYAFNVIKVHRLYGSCLSEHKVSPHMLFALGFTLEGEKRDAIYKHGKYYNLLEYGLLRDEYIRHYNDGLYEIDMLIRSFISSTKNNY